MASPRFPLASLSSERRATSTSLAMSTLEAAARSPISARMAWCAAAGHVDIACDVDLGGGRAPPGRRFRPNGLVRSGGPRRHRLRCRPWRRPGSARSPISSRMARRKAAGQRGSSEDDLPLWLNHAQDRGVGRGLNPAPDERRPAALSMTNGPTRRQHDAKVRSPQVVATSVNADARRLSSPGVRM